MKNVFLDIYKNPLRYFCMKTIIRIDIGQDKINNVI